MHLSAIVLAAGAGLRFSHPNSFTVRGGIPIHMSKMIESGQSQISKPLVKINSRPIIIHCLEALSKHPLVNDITVVVNAKNSRNVINAINKYHISKVSRIVKGGVRRQNSVFNALKTIGVKTDLVLIHDGIRPFIDKKLISSLINEARINGAAIAGVPVKATIKKVKSPCLTGRQEKSKVKSLFVEKTIDRNSLWEIQTPQVFRKDLIFNAYKKFGHLNVTDDSMLVEKLGVRVSVVLGSYKNIKITTPEDLTLAEAFAKTNQKSNC